MALVSAFFDLPRLLRLRAALTDLDPSAPPRGRSIAGPGDPRLRRLAVFPGSFNPLTNAHAALADLALSSGRVDALVYLLASRTVDKERVEGASLADRLLCLVEFLHGRPREGVLLVNRGLYVDQADLMRRLMPSVDDLWFVVGYDKIVQIFDHRYYEDRDAALDRLFTLASFLVSPRAPHRPEDLDTFLTRSANRRYADRVLPLALPTEFQRLSSTRVRAAAALTGPSTQDVPAIVGRFIQETGAYAGPTRDLAGEDVDGYAIRERLIDAAERGGLPALSAAAFRAAIDRLIQPDDDGRRRRAALRRGDVLVATEERLEQTP